MTFAQRKKIGSSWSFGVGITRLLLIAALVLTSIPYALAQSSYYFGRTTDAAPTDIAIPDGGHLIHFLIPKSYLIFSDNWKGGVQNSFVMQIAYPSMRPIVEAGKDTNDTDVIQVNLYSYDYTGAHYTVQNEIERHLKKNDWVQVGNIGKEFKIYVSKDEVQRWKNHDRFVFEHLIPTAQKTSPNIYFDCVPWSDPKVVGCTGKVMFEEHLELEFIFREKRLTDWPDILRAVQKLLTSFRQS